MGFYYVEIGKLPFISKVEGKRDGKSIYTAITKYGCQCGHGEIVKYDAASGESFARISCPECQKKLRPFAEIEGDFFRIYTI